MAADLPRIVHVSADFPDPLVPGKTAVIRSLLELTQDQFAHHAISLNRRAPGLPDMLRLRRDPPVSFEHGEAWIYRAPPLGVGHFAFLRRLGRQLARHLADTPPALLVGHKLSVEGLAVAEAARILNVPYAITIQGNSDAKITAARPDLRQQFARVFHEAAVVFAFAPWALTEMERRLGPRSGAKVLLPCPTDLDEPLPPMDRGSGLLSAFHLAHHRNKNLAGIAAALRLLRAKGDTTPFTLAGGGSAAEIAQCSRQLHGIANVSVLGILDRQALRQAMNRAVGFVLPSHRESFGLVFIEALFAGIPIIYPEGRAIAGWFDDAPFAIPVDPRNPKALAAAMARIVSEEASLKQELAHWQTSEHARQFTRPHIAGKFASAINAVIAKRAVPLPKGLG